MNAKAPACPICGKEAVSAPYLPFCSARCKQLDLGNWLSGRYAIPVAEQNAPDGDEEE